MRYLYKTCWQPMLQGPTVELAYCKCRTTALMCQAVLLTIVYVRSWKHAMRNALGDHNAENRCTELLQTSATLSRPIITVGMDKHIMFRGARRTVNSE